MNPPSTRLRWQIAPILACLAASAMFCAASFAEGEARPKTAADRLWDQAMKRRNGRSWSRDDRAGSCARMSWNRAPAPSSNTWCSASGSGQSVLREADQDDRV